MTTPNAAEHVIAQEIAEIFDIGPALRAHFREVLERALADRREACARKADAHAHLHLYGEPEESIQHRAEQIAASGFIAAAIRSMED